MLTPFWDNENGLGLHHVVQAVATYFNTTLYNLLRGVGRGTCSSFRQYASSLGVSATHPNILRRMRGFLGLAPVGRRIFPLTDSLLAGAQVVCEELTKIDLYQRNDRLPVKSLKGPERPIGHLVDCWTVGEFQRKAFGYPHTFGRALEMVTSMS